MKTFEDRIIIPIKWQFACDGQTLRSTVVGGLQAEIFKGKLTIRDVSDKIYSTWEVGSRRYGRIKARNVLSDWIGGNYK